MIEMPPVRFEADCSFEPESPWQREFLAFQSLLPQLLNVHRGLYVAVYEGRVVKSGSCKLDVAMDAYREFGDVPILVRLVTEDSPRVVSIPTFHR